MFLKPGSRNTGWWLFVADGEVHFRAAFDVLAVAQPLAGRVEFGTHDHRDADKAQPGDQPKDRADGAESLVFALGESSHDRCAEMLQEREDDAGKNRPNPYFSSLRRVVGE